MNADLLPMDAGSGRVFFLESRSNPGTFHITVRLWDGSWWCSCPAKSRINVPGNVTCFHVIEARQRFAIPAPTDDPDAFSRGFDHYKDAADERDRAEWAAARAEHPAGKGPA